MRFSHSGMAGMACGLVFTGLAVAASGRALGQHLTAATTSPSLELVSPWLDAGQLSPDMAEQSAGELRVHLHSDAPWELAVVGPSQDQAPGMAPLRARASSGRWLALPSGMPVVVAAGGPTPSEGVTVAVALGLLVTLDSTAGRQDRQIGVSLNGNLLPLQARVTWEVAPTFNLDTDGGAFDLTDGLDPSRYGAQRMAGKIYTVRANVPWVLEATLDGALHEVVGAMTLGPDALILTDTSGKTRRLTPGTPVVVARGAPTGSSGLPCRVGLAYEVRGGEAAGDYGAGVSFTLRLDAPGAGLARTTQQSGRDVRPERPTRSTAGGM
jgi:hypothetical protein